MRLLFKSMNSVREQQGEVVPPKKNWVEKHAGTCRVRTSKGAVPQYQSNASFVQEPRALLDKDRGSLTWKYLLN